MSAPTISTQGSLREAKKAFEIGDYSMARRIALSLQSDGDSQSSREASLLLGQMSPAPLTKYLLLLTALLLLAVTGAAYIH